MSRLQTPEQRELERKRGELEKLETALAQRELELATSQAELQAFETRFFTVLGGRYAERDALNAQIARAAVPQATATAPPAWEPPTPEAAPSGSRALAPSLRPRRPDPSRHTGVFTPTDGLKQLYRTVAKQIHPDLAADDALRARRAGLMAAANRAYQSGDLQGLEAVLNEWISSPESVEGEGPGVDLVRVIRTIARVEERLRAIESEQNCLRASDLADLRAAVTSAEADGIDLLHQMAGEVDEQIADARQRLHAVESERPSAAAHTPPAVPRPALLPRSAGRTVVVPDDRALGTLFVRMRAETDVGPWVAYGDARGAVRVPAGIGLRLEVSREASTDLAPLAALAADDLDELSLAGTPVDDAGLRCIQGLTALEGLTLGGTRVSDAGLAHLWQLASLRSLHLWRTGVGDGGLAHLAHLSSLRRLYLDQTTVGDAGVALLAPLTGLLALSLASTRVGQAGLRRLRGLAALRTLNLTGTATDDAGLAHLGAMTAIEVLALQRTAIGDGGLRRLHGLTALRTLVLADTTVGDEGVAHIAALPALEWLNLARTRVTDRGIGRLLALSALRGLNLYGALIGDAGVRTLCPLRGLTRLDLGATRVSDGGVAYLSELDELERLSLAQTAITDASLAHIRELTTLRELSLRDTRITDAGASLLRRLSRLRRLDLTGTRTSDTLRRTLRDSLPRCTVVFETSPSLGSER